jgi:hypothetical protein
MTPAMAAAAGGAPDVVGPGFAPVRPGFVAVELPELVPVHHVQDRAGHAGQPLEIGDGRRRDVHPAEAPEAGTKWTHRGAAPVESPGAAA